MENVLILNRFNKEMIDYGEYVDEKSKVYFFTNKRFAEDFKDFDNLYAYEHFQRNNNVELDILKLSKNVKFNKIICVDEEIIELAGLLRTELNIPGLTYNQSLLFRDKVIMKEKLQNSNVKTPKFTSINKVSDIVKFIKENKGPYVVKPRRGMGSQKVYIIQSIKELRVFLKNEDYKKFEIEEYITGDLHAIDGLFVNGKIYNLNIAKYIDSTLSFKQNKGSSYLYYNNNHPVNAMAKDFVKKIITSFNVGDVIFPFHCEVFLNGNNEFVLCEIACRPGGGNMDKAIEIKSGVNPFDSYLTAESGRKLDSPNKNENPDENIGGILIPKTEGMLLRMPEDPPYSWVRDYKKYFKEGDYLVNSDSSSTVLCIAIIEAKNENDFIKKRDRFLDWFYKNLNIDKEEEK